MRSLFRRHRRALGAVLLLSSTSPRPAWAITLWAWIPAQDLRFLEGEKDVRVALYLGTLGKTKGNWSLWPRENPALLPPSTPREAVFRITSREALSIDEAPRAARILLDELQRRERHAPRFEALQIDFDAVESQRPFYLALLGELRAKANRPLTMTALASWCLWDDWLSQTKGLVDAVVPMLFAMGTTGPRAWKEWGRVQPPCHQGVGIAVDEPPPRPVQVRYVFFGGTWTKAEWNRIMRQTSTKPR